MSEHARWTYKVANLPAGLLEQTLNNIGAGGWELVTIWFQSSLLLTGFFKRPASPTQTEAP